MWIIPWLSFTLQLMSTYNWVHTLLDFLSLGYHTQVTIHLLANLMMSLSYQLRNTPLYKLLQFFVNLLIHLLSILIAATNNPLLLTPPSHNSPPLYPPILLRRPLRYHPTLGHLILTRLSISSPIEAQPCSPVRGRRSRDRQKSQRGPLLQMLGESNEDQAAHLL